MISLRVDPGIFSFSLSTLSTSDVEVPHHVRRRVLHNGYARIRLPRHAVITQMGDDSYPTT